MYHQLRIAAISARNSYFPQFEQTKKKNLLSVKACTIL